jgi:AcrR family transcriptional regulator
MTRSAPPAGGPPRRADARRNVAAILGSATRCLARDPDASMAEIAAAAGVGRMTLYGHFKTRADLVDAVFGLVAADAHQAVESVDTSGDPRDALGRLVSANWLIVDQLRNILAAAQRELPGERIHQGLGQVLGRIQDLIERGQHDQLFRTDLPLPWLVSLAMTVMHGAAAEVSAGRLSSGDAPAAVAGTLLAALTPPGAPVPALPPPGDKLSP